MTSTDPAAAPYAITLAVCGDEPSHPDCGYLAEPVTHPVAVTVTVPVAAAAAGEQMAAAALDLVCEDLTVAEAAAAAREAFPGAHVVQHGDVSGVIRDFEVNGAGFRAYAHDHGDGFCSKDITYERD